VREAGHVPIPAFDAMQAMMFAIKHPVPDCIILDIHMPGGAGLDTLRKIKTSAKTSHIPVIVISGSTDAGITEQVMQLGAVTFLGKPLVPEALLVAMRKAFGQETPTLPGIGDR
jgi:CheY-like chemotaxis protein